MSWFAKWRSPNPLVCDNFFSPYLSQNGYGNFQKKEDIFWFFFENFIFFENIFLKILMFFSFFVVENFHFLKWDKYGKNVATDFVRDQNTQNPHQIFKNSKSTLPTLQAVQIWAPGSQNRTQKTTLKITWQNTLILLTFLRFR